MASPASGSDEMTSKSGVWHPRMQVLPGWCDRFRTQDCPAYCAPWSKVRVYGLGFDSLKVFFLNAQLLHGLINARYIDGWTDESKHTAK